MKFNSMWECTPNKPLDTPVISAYIYDHVTLRPLAKDEKGNILNYTRFDIEKVESKTKLTDYIESFRDECDVYKILERCARCGDYSILMGDKPYGDTTPFKADRADNDETLKNLQQANSSLNEDVKSALLNGLSDDEILELIKNLNKSADSPAASESEVVENA